MLVLKHKSNGSKIAARDWIVRINQDGKMLLNTGLDKWSEIVAQVEAAAPAPEPAPAPAPAEPEPVEAPIEPPVDAAEPVPAQPIADLREVRLNGEAFDTKWAEGIRLTGRSSRIRITGGRNIALKDLEVEGQSNSSPGMLVELRAIDGLEAHRVTAVRGVNAICLFGVKNFKVIGCGGDGLGADTFKFGGCEDGVIESNFGQMNPDKLPEAHCDWAQLQGICRRLTFRNNTNLVFGQSLFSGQGPHEDILIENNLFHTGHGHQISLIGTRMVARNNTVLCYVPAASGDGKAAWIKLEGEGNLKEKNIEVASKGKAGIFGSNLVLQVEDAAAPFYAPDYILGMDGTPKQRITDPRLFRLRDGLDLPAGIGVDVSRL